MKALTVGELMAMLQEYDKDLLVTVLHDGKGHHLPIVAKQAKIEEPYFPGEVKNHKDGKKVLRICYV